MIDQAILVLREHHDALAKRALDRLTERTIWSEGDLRRLMELVDVRTQPLMLDAIETEGRLLAQYSDRLDVRLESIERIADALGLSVDEIFTDQQDQRRAARELLRTARRIYITAIARGFQSGVEGIALHERDRGRFVNNRLRAVQRINATINSGMDFGDTLNSACKILAEELHVDLCAIFLYDTVANDLTLQATNRTPGELIGHFTVRLGEPLTGEVVKLGVPRGFRDMLEMNPLPVEAHLFGRLYRSIMIVPIIFFNGDGTILEGAVTLLSEEQREYSSEEISFLELMAGLLAMSIENSHIYSRTDELVRRQVASITTLQRVSATVANAFDLSRVLDEIVLQAAQLSGAAMTAIFQTESSGRLHLTTQHNLQTRGMLEQRVTVGECCVGRAAEEGTHVWGLDCMHKDETCFFRQVRDQISEVHTALAMPMHSKGQIQGVLCLLSHSRHVQPATLSRMVETFANEAAVAIESTGLYEETMRSLELKTQLLQEMHHRVKNNLLSITAILRMERRRTTSAEAAKVLAESISRIDGMAATHDLLSREERIGTARIDEIAMKLVGVVTAHLLPPNIRVDFDIRPKDSAVEVQSRNALVLALILNELLANAIEHGIADREQGHVWLGIWETANLVHLVVADDGNSIPPGLDLSHSTQLGLALVRDMTRDQLHGTFRLQSAPLPVIMRDHPEDETPWTIAAIEFPLEREHLSMHAIEP